jgi:hypothetical protein
MLPVDDTEVRWTIMKYLAGLIDAGHIEPLIAAGLPPELLDVLRNRRLRDITRIAEDASISFHIRLDSQRLTSAFLRLDAVIRDKELLEYFVRHRAPSQMLTRIFRVGSQELRAMREILCTNDTEHGGRPIMPDHTVREHIHAAWAALQVGGTNRPERERLYALHQKFEEYTVGALWAVLIEFGDPEAATPAKPPQGTSPQPRPEAVALPDSGRWLWPTHGTNKGRT